MSIDDNKPLRLSGRVLTIFRLRIQTSIPQTIVEELTKLTLENPMLQQGLPVIIESEHDIDLAWLIKVLKKTGAQVLGVANGVLNEQALALELPILPADLTQTKPKETTSATPSSPQSNTPEPLKRATKVIADPVRSGQQVYAEGSDLIVIAPVSAGAELIADGNIHIYGVLRGRAIAGATGNPNVRIFCKRLEADLVAIAGVYMIAEEMPKHTLGKSVQIKLDDNGSIVIEVLD